jgi:hypothetical protein
MGLKDSLTSVVVNLMIERPATRQGFANLIVALEKTGQTLTTRFSTLADTQKNRDTLRHIIAIEKWGQRRLGVALGEAFVQDENHAYKPAEQSSWEELKSLFDITRLETLELAKTLSSVNLSQTVPHNQWGPLSVLGWLRYLTTHASLEGKRLK